MINTIQTHKTQETQLGDITIIRDGKPMYCPYQPAIPTQSSMGGIQLIKTECNSQCPHFNFDAINIADGFEIEVNLTCGIGVKFHIEEHVKHNPIKLNLDGV